MMLAAQALFAATTVLAQDKVADVWVYDTNKCASDSFGLSADLEIFAENKVLSGPDGTWTCRYSQNVLEGFNQTGTDYIIFVDETTLPKNCSLVLYKGAPGDADAASGVCQTYYSTIRNSNGGCLQTSIGPEFGYA